MLHIYQFANELKLQTNLAGRDALIAALKIHIGDAREYDDIWDMLPVETPKVGAKPPSAKPVDGSVYLIESGEFFKVGRSDELERCAKEIRVALPNAATLLRTIATDDPPGIGGAFI